METSNLIDEFNEFVQQIETLHMSTTHLNSRQSCIECPQPPIYQPIAPNFYSAPEPVQHQQHQQQQFHDAAQADHHHHHQNQRQRPHSVKNDDHRGMSSSILDGSCKVQQQQQQLEYGGEAMQHRNDENMTNIKVTVGIDEDLKMILEMDPSIVDLGGTPTASEPKVLGLPPISGG